MDSSKQKDAKKKEGGNKGASTAQGGSNKVAEGRHKFSSTVLNDLPPEIIDLIADWMSIMDCLNTQKAFASDPEPAVNNIRNGLAINLTKQSALYLLMDTDEYDGKYQYNYQMGGEPPNALLPTLEGLPIASESSKVITLPELLPGGSLISIGRLKRTFPNLVELKFVLRELSPAWLTKLAKVVAAFSRQLTGLQLLIFSDSLELTTLWGTNHLLRLFSHLNDAHFDRLRHFTLLFKDTEYKRIYPLDMKLLRLLSSETLEECYLRLPGQVIDPQLKLLRENQRLQRLGLIAYINKSEGPNAHHSAIHLSRLEQFTSFARFRFRLNTDAAYLTLMEKLSGGRLKHLELYLHCVPVPVLTLNRLSQLAPCSPSVTHLKIEVESIRGLDEGDVQEELVEFSHETFTHQLHVLRHFPNLQHLEVVFPFYYCCSLCKVNPGDEGRECMEKAMQSFRARDQLKLTYSIAQ